MLSTNGVGIRPSSQFGLGISDPGTMETGDFDFITYLLGLQGTDLLSEASGTSSPELSAVLPKDDKQKIEEPVVALFQQGNTAAVWNPLVAGNSTMMTPLKVSQDNLLAQTDKGTDLGRQKQQGFEKTNLVSNADLHPHLAETKTQSEDIGFLDSLYGEKSSENVNPKAQIATQQKEIGLKKYGNFAGVAAKDSASEKPSEGVQIKSVHTEDKTSQVDHKTALNSQAAHTTNAKDTGIEGSHRKRGLSGGSGVEWTSGLLSSPETHRASVQSTSGTEKGTHVREATIPQLFDRVESMASQGGGNMTVRLSPPSLGEIEIKVTTRGKKVEIEMRSENEAAKSAIEGQIGDLKDSMFSNDLVLSKMEVHVNREVGSTSFDASVANQTGGNPSFQSSLSQGSSSQSESGRHFTRHEPKTTASFQTAPVQASARPTASIGSGRVDLKI